jgi:hypothetical protein
MNSAAAFLTTVQAIVALSIFVAFYLAFVICAIICLVATELICEHGRILRDCWGRSFSLDGYLTSVRRQRHQQIEVRHG